MNGYCRNTKKYFPVKKNGGISKCPYCGEILNDYGNIRHAIYSKT